MSFYGYVKKDWFIQLVIVCNILTFIKFIITGEYSNAAIAWNSIGIIVSLVFYNLKYK